MPAAFVGVPPSVNDGHFTHSGESHTGTLTAEKLSSTLPIDGMGNAHAKLSVGAGNGASRARVDENLGARCEVATMT